MLRRRCEGLVFLGLAPALGAFLCVALVIRFRRRRCEGPGVTRRRITIHLRRWWRFVLHGLHDLRLRWWREMSYEVFSAIWRYVVLLEWAELESLASKSPDASGAAAANRLSREGHTILVWHPGHLGDLLLTVPMLKALRKHRPSAQIHLLVGPWNRVLGNRIPYVDRVLVCTPRWGAYDRMSNSAPSLSEEAGFLRALRKTQYDTLIYGLAGGLPECAWVRAIEPRIYLGAPISMPDLYAYPFVLREVRYDSSQYEAVRLMNLLGGLGIADEEAELEFVVSNEDRIEADALLRGRFELADALLIALAPGAGWPGKQWPRERFAEISRLLSEQYDATILLLGAASEKKIGDQIAAILPGRAINLFGQTSLGGLAGLLQRSALLISNDNGVYHLGVAIGIPVVGLFGPGHPIKWASPQSRCRNIWHKPDCTCFPWHLKAVCVHEQSCMRAISVEEVIGAARELLREPT